MIKYQDGKDVTIGDRVLADVNGMGEPCVIQQLLATGHVTVAYPVVNAGSGVVEIRKADVHPNACLRIEEIKLEVPAVEEAKVEEPPAPPREPQMGEKVLFNPDGNAWLESTVIHVFSPVMVNLRLEDNSERTSVSLGEDIGNWRFKP